MESTHDWCARIGSREAMDERQALRLAGKCNKPIRPRPHRTGLRTTHGHPWECECDMCRPWLWSDGNKIDSDRPELKAKYAKLKKRKAAHEPPKLIVVPSQPVPKRRGKRWRNKGTSGN